MFEIKRLALYPHNCQPKTLSQILKIACLLKKMYFGEVELLCFFSRKFVSASSL